MPKQQTKINKTYLSIEKQAWLLYRVNHCTAAQAYFDQYSVSCLYSPAKGLGSRLVNTRPHQHIMYTGVTRRWTAISCVVQSTMISNLPNWRVALPCPLLILAKSMSYSTKTTNWDKLDKRKHEWICIGTSLPHICRHWHEQTLSQLWPCSESWRLPCHSPGCSADMYMMHLTIGTCWDTYSKLKLKYTLPIHLYCLCSTRLSGVGKLWT